MWTIQTRIVNFDGDEKILLDKYLRTILKRIRKTMGEVPPSAPRYEYELLMKMEIVYEALLRGELHVNWR